MITLHGDTRAHFVAAEWRGSDFGSFRPCQRDERAEEDSRQREGRVRTSGCNTAEHVQAVTDLGGDRVDGACAEWREQHHGLASPRDLKALLRTIDFYLKGYGRAPKDF